MQGSEEMRDAPPAYFYVTNQEQLHADYQINEMYFTNNASFCCRVRRYTKEATCLKTAFSEHFSKVSLIFIKHRILFVSLY